MIKGFTEIGIAVPELATAIADYRCLLGAELDGSGRLALRNVAIKLVRDEACSAPQIRSLGLWLARDTEPLCIDDQRGLCLPQHGERSLMATDGASSTGITAVDHIVLMSSDAEDCIRLFGDRGFGMRLALDRQVPEWGGRMLFFRCGKMTLEVIHTSMIRRRLIFSGASPIAPGTWQQRWIFLTARVCGTQRFERAANPVPGWRRSKIIISAYPRC